MLIKLEATASPLGLLLGEIGLIPSCTFFFPGGGVVFFLARPCFLIHWYLHVKKICIRACIISHHSRYVTREVENFEIC